MLKRKTIRKITMMIVLSSVTVFAGDWVHWRGPNKDGVLHDDKWNPKALNGGAKVVWEAQLGLSYSAVAVKGEMLYAIGNKEISSTQGEDIIYCLNAKTGEEIWRFTYPCKTSERWPGPTATPVVDGNRLYTICDDTGDLYCLNAVNGRVFWKRNVVQEFGTIPPYDGVGYSGSAYIEGNLLLLNLNKAGIALNKMSGETVWASAAGRCSFSTPVVFNNGSHRKMALFGAEKMFIIDIPTGKVESSYPWKTNCNENTMDPIIVGDKVFISSAYGMGCALLKMSKNKLDLVWKNMEMSNQFTCSVYLDGYVYGYDGERPRCSLKCIEYESGKEMWSQRMPFGSLIISNGKLVVQDEDGVLHIAEATPDGYQEISSSHVQNVPANQRARGGRNRKYWWTNPVLVDGYVYVRSDKGDLVCLDMRK